MAQIIVWLAAFLLAVSAIAQTPTRVDVSFYAGTLLDSTYIDTTNKGVKVVCASGCSGGTQYTEDDAAPANPVGGAQQLVRQDTPATLVSLDGDIVTRRGTNYGAAYTQVVTSAGAFVDTFGGGTQYTQGDIDATITGTAAMMEVAADTLQPIQGTVAGGLLVDITDTSIAVSYSSGTFIVGDGAGAMNVICDSGCAGGAQYTEGDIDATITGTAMMMEGAADTMVAAQGTAANGLEVDVTRVQGTVAVTQSGTWDEVGINDSGNAITIDWAGTAPPIGAGLEATALRVTVATDSTGVLSVDDNGGELTVNYGSGTFVVGDGAGALNVIVDSGTITVGTFPDNEPFNVAQINGVTPLMGNGITGTGSQRVTIASDNTAFTVNVGTFPDNEPINVAQMNGVAVTMGNGIAGTGVQRMTLASDSTGNIATIGTSVTPGTAAGNLGKPEDGAHTSADVGVFVLGVRNDADVTPTEFCGADAEYCPIAVDSFGMLPGTIWAPWGWSYHENSSSALTDTTVHASCGTGLFNYISTIVFSSGAATQMTLLIEDSTTTTILGPYYLEAVNGRGAVINFQPAKKQTTSATLISVTTTGAIAHSIDITGYCGR